MATKFVSIILIITIIITTISSSIITIPLLLLQSAQTATSSGRVALLYSGPRASITASGSSNVYVTWWDNKTTGNNEVFFAASTDKGKTFGKTINLSNASGGSADSQLAASDNNVHVTWWDNKTGDWQVYSRTSTDKGKTFGDAIMLKSIGSSPIKKLTAPPSNTISVDTVVASAFGENEYVSWWDNKTGNWEVLFAKSIDGGKTFGDPINISNSPNARSVGARMAVQGNNVYITWMDINTNTGQKQVFFRASNDEGKTFGNPIMLNSTLSSASSSF